MKKTICFSLCLLLAAGLWVSCEGDSGEPTAAPTHSGEFTVNGSTAISIMNAVYIPAENAPFGDYGVLVLNGKEKDTTAETVDSLILFYFDESLLGPALDFDDGNGGWSFITAYDSSESLGPGGIRYPGSSSPGDLFYTPNRNGTLQGSFLQTGWNIQFSLHTNTDDPSKTIQGWYKGTPDKQVDGTSPYGAWSPTNPALQ